MRDLSCAEAVVRRMKDLNELNDAAISRFAETRKFDEVAASLAVLNNSAPTMRLPAYHRRAQAFGPGCKCQASSAAYARRQLDRPAPQAFRTTHLGQPSRLSHRARSVAWPSAFGARSDLADITYIRLREAFGYLAVILDGFSRKVVGWA
jgi:transposase InsO family protein